MDKAVKIVLVIAVFGIAIALIIPKITKDTPGMDSTDLDSLREVNRQIEHTKDSLFEELKKEEMKSDSLELLRQEQNIKITKINRSTDEKIRIIYGYNDNELDSFFSSINIKAAADTVR